MHQLKLFDDESVDSVLNAGQNATAEFSHNSVASDIERKRLEARYASILNATNRFNRRSVSFQGNKGQILHSWVKYREGFSAELVDTLFDDFCLKPGDSVLEPFSGSATTLLVAKSKDVHAAGIEILPNCHLAWEAKSLVYDYDVGELVSILDWIGKNSVPPATGPFPHLRITDSAFSSETEADLMGYTEWAEKGQFSHTAQVLLKLLLTSILEEVSYTRKDGQYLRWDSRAEKVRTRNEIRLKQGKPVGRGLDKGVLPSVKSALRAAMTTVINDIKTIQRHQRTRSSVQNLIEGSSLDILPTLPPDQFSAVVTSPPYCNRYDYTRTYALELAYLGVTETEIRRLRQRQVSCTVEHSSKIHELEVLYESLGQHDRFKHILRVIRSNAALQEINAALTTRWNRGDLNNRGVLQMIDGYFIEMGFVFAEILRTAKPGASIAFVNDNVRYGGEVIPVDLITTSIAEDLGFQADTVHVLVQRKGNSSQQMGKFGRAELRKCITIWRKPA